MNELNQIPGDGYIDVAENLSKEKKITIDQALLSIIADEINAMRIELVQLKEKINELSDSATKK
ncbi:hypothetical protein ACT4R9_05415 [Ornithobacterium rhinotracheale]|uniref:hypothetical protein n=1 Tax=Ornithobacterium rhinotracheale TaxID=28251 RepID=UPI00129C5AAB|nr:hypothetical protein [Ornithobacterium rhinotracheale]MRI63784.1 hypothetical protein [Ornithobacterium rhinotracheale]